MKEKFTIEDLRKRGDDTLVLVFDAIDEAPGVAIIGEQDKHSPNKWALLGDNRKQFVKHISECEKLVQYREESYIPSKKDKIALKKWDKLIQKIIKMLN